MAKLTDVNVPDAKGVSKLTNQGEQPKPALAAQIKEMNEDAILAKATQQAYAAVGVPVPGADAQKKEDPLATQIVTKSMENQNKLMENMQKTTLQLQEEVKIAQKSANDMQFQLLQNQMTQLQNAQVSAESAGAPKSSFEHYVQVKDELGKLLGDIEKREPAPQQVGMSDATQIELKKLELQQNQALAQIQADNTLAQNAFNLKMQEFEENKATRRLEYEDKKTFRTDGMQGLTDLVTAIGAGISQKGGPTSEVSEEVTQEPAKRVREEVMGAHMYSFKCGYCKTEVPVRDGQEAVTCPNPECSAVFTIKAQE